MQNRQPANGAPHDEPIEAIQPLREVGTLCKTQYWSFEEIEDAIREANLLGIDPHKLFGTAQGGINLPI